ncbi:MAG: hypothetical protein BRD41_00950, partial [Bacteroidetes bacterium QS_1_63_11]
SGVPTGGYAAFVGALSAAAADTWATELGTISGTPPWSPRSWCRVPAGTSGAVSLVGSGGAVLGATSVAGAAVLTGGVLSGHAGRDAAFLAGAGLAGMLADSVAGAFLQAQYRSAAGHWVETPPTPEANPVRGWAGIGNNVGVLGRGPNIGVSGATDDPDGMGSALRIAQPRWMDRVRPLPKQPVRASTLALARAYQAVTLMRGGRASIPKRKHFTGDCPSRRAGGCGGGE